MGSRGVSSRPGPRTPAPLTRNGLIYLCAALVCIALGAITAAGTAWNPIYAMVIVAVLIASATLRWPAMALVGALVIATLGGRDAAHWTIPVPALGLPLPVLETLLALSAGAALLHLVSSRSLTTSSQSLVVLLWIPSAVWGLALFVLANEGDLISGARETLLFVYPLLVALPLAATRASSVRRFVEERAWILIFALALAVTAIGAWNFATGGTLDLPTGQVRSLSGERSSVLAAGAFTALWLLEARRHRLAGIVLLAASLMGLVFVNHRSAYVGVILAGLLYVLAHPRRDPSTKRLAPTMLIAALAGLILAVTPLGQAGVDRFIATVETDDPNVQFRFGAISAAVEKDDVWEAAYGSGVGLQPTELGGTFDPLTVTRIEPHNSYVSMFQRGGVVGVLLLVVPMLYCIWEMLKQRADPQIRILLSIAVFTTVMAGFNVVLENFYFGAWVWLPLLGGTMLALSRRAGSTTAQAP